MFNSYFLSSPEFFSPYFPKKYNDFDLVPLRKFKTKLLFRLASGANKRSHTHVNRGRPRILKQTLRSTFPEASKETAVVPRKTSQSFLTGSKDGGVVKTACTIVASWQHSASGRDIATKKSTKKTKTQKQAEKCLSDSNRQVCSLVLWTPAHFFQVISLTDFSSVLLQWSRWSEV